jgi:hypothetical protein
MRFATGRRRDSFPVVNKRLGGRETMTDTLQSISDGHRVCVRWWANL